MVFSLLLGGIFYFARRKKTVSLSTRGVFGIVCCAWLTISLYGAIPLLIGGYTKSLTDAFFESASAFSTTGATIFNDVESLPRSINLWRCEMHWLGGMGVIALTVALLPLLGVGGFQLIKAESTGPEKGKITPKMANTAKLLWIIYMSFTLIEAIILLFCGLDVIDSICYAFSTLGTGGFATKNASVGSYGNAAVEIVCTVFMFLAGINFSLYFYALTGKFDEIRKNSELKAYVSIFAIVLAGLVIILTPFYGSIASALRYGSFQLASILTTTGFMTSDYTMWPSSAQFLIFILFFMGGCSGSTGGGFKIVRWVVLSKQAKNEMMRMLHPHGIFSIRLNGRAGRKDLVFAVASFTFVYIILTSVTTFFGTVNGLDLWTSFSAALSMIGNVGPAFGALGPTENYSLLAPALKWWYCFAMIAGRLELYNLIIFFTRDFWKK